MSKRVAKLEKRVEELSRMIAMLEEKYLPSGFYVPSYVPLTPYCGFSCPNCGKATCPSPSLGTAWITTKFPKPP